MEDFRLLQVLFSYNLILIKLGEVKVFSPIYSKNIIKMGQKNKIKSHVVLAICMVLIGAVAAYFAPLYEDAVHGSTEKGIYGVLNYISNFFMFTSFLIVLILIFKTFSKNEKHK